MSAEKGTFQKERLVFQPSFFRGELLVFGGSIFLGHRLLFFHLANFFYSKSMQLFEVICANSKRFGAKNGRKLRDVEILCLELKALWCFCFRRMQ